MKRMKLSELTGNEILAQSLMTWDYQIILPEGVVLKKEYRRNGYPGGLCKRRPGK